MPAQLAIGLGVVAISAVLAIGASRFPPEMGFVIMAAYVYPYAVAAFLGVVGLLMCYQALTGGFRNLGDDHETTQAQPGGKPGDLGHGGACGRCLAHYLHRLRIGGGTAVCLSARGFGSRSPLRDLAIGIALTLPIYWLFTAGLGVSLPPLVNAWI